MLLSDANQRRHFVIVSVSSRTSSVKLVWFLFPNKSELNIRKQELRTHKITINLCYIFFSCMEKCFWLPQFVLCEFSNNNMYIFKENLFQIRNFNTYIYFSIPIILTFIKIDFRHQILLWTQMKIKSNGF